LPEPQFPPEALRRRIRKLARASVSTWIITSSLCKLAGVSFSTPNNASSLCKLASASDPTHYEITGSLNDSWFMSPRAVFSNSTGRMGGWKYFARSPPNIPSKWRIYTHKLLSNCNLYNRIGSHPEQLIGQIVIIDFKKNCPLERPSRWWDVNIKTVCKVRFHDGLLWTRQWTRTASIQSALFKLFYLLAGLG
jgi:hypothetical protein